MTERFKGATVTAVNRGVEVRDAEGRRYAVVEVAGIYEDGQQFLERIDLRLLNFRQFPNCIEPFLVEAIQSPGVEA